MRLQRALETIGQLAAQQVVAQGILDDGRLFALGLFEKENQVHGRVRDVVQGLKEHVGQPFERHSWAVVFDMSFFKQTGHTSRMSLLGACAETLGSVHESPAPRMRGASCTDL